VAGQTIATAYVAILPSFKGGAAAIGKELDGPLGVAGAAGGAAYGGGMKTKVAGMAKSVFAPLLAVGAGVAIGQFFGGAIKEASGLNESVNAINVSYGDAAGGVQDLGKKAATSLGLSNLEFNNLAVRFSSFSKTIAGDGGDVTGTLDDLTTRASDFASVMNLDVNEAAQLFQSGLAGESEPLRKYGIDMSAASVEAFGLANGLAANGKSLTESEKVQARYGLIMEQTSKTQGDFANTSDQLANKQRIVSSQFADVKAKIGTGLLPIMSALVGFVGDNLIPALEGASSGAQRFAKWVGDSAGPIKTVAAIIGTLLIPMFVSLGVKAAVAGAKQVWSWVTSAGSATKSAATQFASHYKVVAGWIASAAAAVASGAETVAIWALYKIEAIKGAAITVASHARMAAAWLASKATAVASMAVTVATMVAGWAVMGVQALLGAAKIALAWIIAMGPIAIVIAAVIGLGVLIFKNMDTIKGWISAAWNWIKDVTSTVWDAIKAAPAAAFKFIKDAFLKYTPLGIIISHWDQIKSAVGNAITGAVDFVKAFPGRVVSALGNLGSLLYNSGKDLIQGLLDGATGLLSSIGSFFLDKVPAFIREPFKRALGINSPSTVFAGFGANIGEGLLVGVDSMQAEIDSSMRTLVAVPSMKSPTFGRSNSNPNGGAGMVNNQYITTSDPEAAGLAAVRHLIARES